MASKSFFTEQITGLYNGVSTQPDLMRLENQANEQINFISDISRGLESRNGTELIRPIASDSNITSNSFITKIDKNTKSSDTSSAGGTDAVQFTDDYIVCFTGQAYDASTNQDGAIEIFDKNGIKQEFSSASTIANNYIVTTTPNKSIRTALIEDYMIVLNTEKVTAMTTNSDTNTFNDNTAIIVVEGNPSDNFTFYIKRGSASRVGITTTMSTPTTDSFNNIAQHIKVKIDAETSLDVTVTVTENIVKIKSNTDSISTYQFYNEDKLLDSKINIINQNVAKASQLPKLSGYDGYVLNITGVDEQNTLANYYVSWNATKQIWEETVEPGLDFKIDETTMPHFLIKTGKTTDSDGNTIGQFQFVAAGDTTLTNQRSAKSYVNRLVGDNDSNPIPSFIGKRLVDISFFRNRLAYLGEDSLVMSRSNDYFNLFNTSAIFTASNDPIDIFIGTNFSVLPRFMEQYQGGIIVFTENAQFVVYSSDQSLTPATVRLEKITDYKVNEDVHPVRLGENTYFADSLGNNAVIRKYIVKDNKLVKDAISITDHVDSYIPKDLKFITGIPNKGMIILAPLNDAKTLYVYFSYSQGGKLVQSAWSKFTFNFDIFGAVVFDNDLYFIDKSGENRNISKLDLFNNDNQLQVDQLVKKDSTNYTITETTENNIKNFTMPFKVETDNTLHCFSEVNNVLKDIFATKVTQVTAPEAGVSVNFSSKVAVPNLKDYVPTTINLAGAWINDYNGDYNEFTNANSIDDKAYKLLTGTKKLIDFNKVTSTTGRYEISGLGVDPAFPDFVTETKTFGVEASRDNLNEAGVTNTYTREVGGILPAQQRDDSGNVDNTDGTTNNNVWLMNLNVGGTPVERKTFLKFIGNGEGGLNGNYVQLSGNASPVSTANEFYYETTVFLDSDSRTDSAIFATLPRTDATTTDYIAVIRVGLSQSCQIRIRSNNVNYDFYADGLFDSRWHTLKFEWYYGALTLLDNGNEVTLYSSSPFGGSTSREISNEIPLTSGLTPHLSTSSTLGYELNAPVMLKGYMTNWEYTESPTNGTLEVPGIANDITHSSGIDKELLATPYSSISGTNPFISLPNHTLGNKFDMTIRAIFKKTTQAADAVIYTSNNDVRGIYNDEVFTIIREGSTNWTELRFIPLQSTAHKTFETLPDIPYVWVHDGNIGEKITGLKLIHSSTNTGIPITWGDGEGETATSNVEVNHTYTSTATKQYIDGSESLYFNNLYDDAAIKKLDVSYDNGTVKVYIDNVQVTTYATADTGTPKDTITTYGGFPNECTTAKVMGGETVLLGNDQLYFGKLPTVLRERRAEAVLSHFKIKNVLEYRFQDSDSQYTIEDQGEGTKDATIPPNVPHFYGTWTPNTATNTNVAKYTFENNLEEDTSANVDASGTKVGAKITDSGSGNYDGVSKINTITNYVDTWVLPPEITYYPRVLSFGYPTESSYTMSPYFLRRKKEAIGTGRLNIKALDVSFQEAVNFFLEIKMTGRDTYIKEYSSQVGLTVSDTPNVTKGTHKFGLNSNADNLTLTIKNNSPYRSRFVAIGYEGSFINRSKIR